ncbi:hypothetical protein PGTUg99_029575 [Puccinia graminis f. sp. tritici]|uniref:Uncharacterized protein n=1 Tax=Puccinia graminis f. sp. tritici TaxID=56615 RepID=A0A5B0RHK6_PUCGR|nr:hypothetical protein PGTUg99_029575 [Puccinia graminis f. sp. tritici]
MAPESTQTQSEIIQDTNGHSTDQSQTQPRRSTRASSVVLTPNMVTPSSDSRVRMTQPESKKRGPGNQSSSASVSNVSTSQGQKKRKNKKSRTQISSEKGKNGTTSLIPNQKENPKGSKAVKKVAKKTTRAENPEGAAFDYDQESDEQSVKIQPRTAKKIKEALYAKVLDYFEEPVWKKGDREDTALNYKCKWCPGTYRAHPSLLGNLKAHRDGYTQMDKNNKGCVNRDQAKLAGIKLPPSVAEAMAIKEKSKDSKQPGITDFLSVKVAFDNKVLNQIMMIWQIRQALPWSRLEDPYLWAAIQYANHKARLYGCRWSADELKKLYRMLKTCVFDNLKKLDTKFTLVHDVWTTKGN